jgi:hypothetical protein
VNSAIADFTFRGLSRAEEMETLNIGICKLIFCFMPGVAEENQYTPQDNWRLFRNANSGQFEHGETSLTSVGRPDYV